MDSTNLSRSLRLSEGGWPSFAFLQMVDIAIMNVLEIFVSDFLWLESRC